jgi:hypothetical protein
MDVADGLATENNNIQLWGRNNTKAQRWALKPVDEQLIKDGVYKIASSLNLKKVLDVTGNIKKDGTNIQLWDDNGTDAQKWNITFNEDGETYAIKNMGSDQAIDVLYAQKTNGANVQMWKFNNSCAQLWRATKNSEGSITFGSTCSQLVLDVSGGLFHNGSNIQIWRYNGTAAQKWFLKNYE